MTTVVHRKPQTRAARRRAQRKRGARVGRPWLPLASVGAVIVVAAVVAVMVTGGSAPVAGGNETASVSITGAALPAPAIPDAAAGMRAPVLKGSSFDGTSITVPIPATPTIVVLLAHWCPHCRNDVPAIQSWLNANTLAGGVRLVAVSTWVDRAKPNYPPSVWLHDEGWTPPVLADDANGSAASAYGLQGTPMWVFIGADGIVKFRIQGEITGAQLGSAANRLLAG